MDIENSVAAIISFLGSLLFLFVALSDHVSPEAAVMCIMAGMFFNIMGWYALLKR